MNQHVENREQIGRLRALRIIGVYLRRDNGAFLIDHVSSWHRQGPAIVAIDVGQVIFEDLEIYLPEIARECPAQAEPRGDFIGRVGQYWESQAIVPARFAAVCGGLRGDRDQLRAPFDNVRQDGLKSLEFAGAVRDTIPRDRTR